MQVSSVKASESEVLNMRNEANSVRTETLQTIEALSVSWNQLLAACDLKNFTCFNFLISRKSSFVLSPCGQIDQIRRSTTKCVVTSQTAELFFIVLLSLRSRRLEVVGTRENGRARRRHARGKEAPARKAPENRFPPLL